MKHISRPILMFSIAVIAIPLPVDSENLSDIDLSVGDSKTTFSVCHRAIRFHHKEIKTVGLDSNARVHTHSLPLRLTHSPLILTPIPRHSCTAAVVFWVNACERNEDGSMGNKDELSNIYIWFRTDN